MRSALIPPLSSGLGAGFSPHGMSLLVAVFLAIKIGASLWTASLYERYQYDGDHHVWRAREGGLQLHVMAYNPPLYYMPALLLGEDAEDADRMALLRYTNVAYITAFYLLWIFVIFPRVLPDHRSASVASLIVLALPGYQKLVAMVHPDNLLNLMVAASLGLWLHLRATRSTSERSDWAGLTVFACLIGVTGLTRPFAAPVVCVLWFAALAQAAVGRRLLSRAFLARALAVTTLVGCVSLSWYVARGVHTGTWGGGYNQAYIEPYVPYRATFDYGEYFSSFYFFDLLEVPNRTIRDLDEVNGRYHNKYGNSFFTLLYSETWADHWLYFSSATRHDAKVWFKRIVFVLALPLIPLLGFRFGMGIKRIGAAMRARSGQLQPGSVLLALFVMGVAFYFYWHLTSGLTPGKNSSVKFIYNAYLYPIAIAIAMGTGMRGRAYAAWTSYAIVLFVAALPLALYFPEA